MPRTRGSGYASGGSNSTVRSDESRGVFGSGLASGGVGEGASVARPPVVGVGLPVVAAGLSLVGAAGCSACASAEAGARHTASAQAAHVDALWQAPRRRIGTLIGR